KGARLRIKATERKCQGKARRLANHSHALFSVQTLNMSLISAQAITHQAREIQTKRSFSESLRLRLISTRLDSSIRSKSALWTYALFSAGFLVRIWHASGTFLNSDEVMHFAAANQTSWLQTYKVSLAISHPPLLIFVLHMWRALGTSELMLRMPSILAGMAFCWFTFRWAEMLFEKTVTWMIFVFVLFLPSSIELSTEIRQYALFLAFAMG